MSKRFLFRLFSAAIILFALLSYLLVEFGVLKIPVKYDIGIFFLILMAGFGVLNLVSGILRANKYNLFFAAVFLSGTAIYLNAEFFKYKVIIVVVACLVLFAACYLLSVLLSGGVTPITADNEKTGYKNYKKRLEDKREEEEKEERQLAKDIKKGKAEDIKIKSFKD